MTTTALKEHFEAATRPPPGWAAARFFTNDAGQSVRYGFAPTQNIEKKGTIILTHGYDESIDLYFEAIKFYQSKGFDVWGMDWQGYGRSERDDKKDPLKPDLSDMETHVRDLHHFTTRIVNRVPGKPLVLSTHSMGGHISLLYLQKQPGVFDGAIMSAPMFDIYRLGLPAIFRPVIRAFFNVASALGLRDTELPGKYTQGLLEKVTRVGNWLRGAGDETIDNPRLAWRSYMRNWFTDDRVGRPTFGWVASAYRYIADSLSPEKLKSLKIPVLIGSAGKEDLVDNRAHARASALMPLATHLYFPDAQHNIWHEKQHNFQRWTQNISQFLDQLPHANTPVATSSCALETMKYPANTHGSKRLATSPA